MTYPKVFGIEASKKKAKELIDIALRAIENFDQKAEPLREIAKYIIKRSS